MFASTRLTRAAALLVFLMTLVSSARGENPPLIVGMEMNYPPFEMTDENGKPEGVSVDLAKALGEFLQRPVVFENFPFPGLIPALKTGKVHCVISSMSRTQERARSIDFSEPYLQSGLAILTGKNSGIESIGDLDRPNRTVAVKLGTTSHVYAVSNLKSARVLVLDKETECAMEVAQGKADAFIYDQMSIYNHWKKNPETTRALLASFQQDYWAIGVRKGDDALREQINMFLKEYKAKGGFEKLGDKWFAEQKAAFEKLGVSFYF